jgi:hypothetical protein
VGPEVAFRRDHRGWLGVDPLGIQVDHVEFLDGRNERLGWFCGRGDRCVLGGSLLAWHERAHAIDVRRLHGEGFVSGVFIARRRSGDSDRRPIGIVGGGAVAPAPTVNAHTSAIEHGGHTIAVVGSPVDAAYPAAHAEG